MLIIYRILFVIIFLAIPFNVLAMDAYYEDDLKEHLLQSRNILETADEKIKSSQPADTEIKELSDNLEGIKAYQVLFQERLNERLERKKISVLDATEAHIEIVNDFNEALKDYINTVESILPESLSAGDNELSGIIGEQTAVFDQQVIDKLGMLLSELLFENTVSLNSNTDTINLYLKGSDHFAGGKDIPHDIKQTGKVDSHKLIRELAKQAVKEIDREKDFSDSLDNVLKTFKKAETEEAAMYKKLREIDKKIHVIDSPVIKERQRKALADYKNRSSELKEHMEALKRSEDIKDSPEIVRGNLNGLIEFLDKYRAQDEYDLLGNESSLPWRVAEPGEIILLGDTVSLPQDNVLAVSVGAPVGDDLAETIDVQITPEIQALADSLGNDPLEIYRYVYNNYDYAPYYGSLKGSLDTYWEKEGNDYDLSSLLIALLRASNIPARYVRTNVLMRIEQVMALVDIYDPMGALSYLSSGGFPRLGYGTDSKGRGYARIEHVYVEAYLPYSNYRGTGEDSAGELWVPLDPTIKKYRVLQEGLDFASEMGFDWKTLFDEYIANLQGITPMEYYEKRVENFVSDNYPNETVDSLKRTMEIDTMQFDFLPGTLPFYVTEVIDSFSEVPQELRGTVRFRMGASILDYTANLPDLLGRRVTLSYTGATADDQAVIDEFGGVVNTPPYLIAVKALLKVDGVVIAEGASQAGGIMVGFSVDYKRPGREIKSSDHHVVAGSINAIGMTVGRVRPERMDFSEVDTSDDFYMSKMLHAIVMKYHDTANKSGRLLNETMKMKSRPLFREALVSSHHAREMVYGLIPTGFQLAGLKIDAQDMLSVIMAVDGYDRKRTIDLMMMGGIEASYQENRVFEENIYWTNGGSAIKGLQALKALGVGIIELTPPYRYPWNPNIPQNVIDDINDALNMGWHVIAPLDTGGIPVVPYIKYDPESGSAGYMIATLAGGYNEFIDADVELYFLLDGMMWGGHETIKKIEFEALYPPSGRIYALGRYVYVGIRRTVTFEHRETGQERVMVTDKNSAGGPWELILPTGTGWETSRTRMPKVWSVPGHIKLKYDGLIVHDFYLWGVQLDLAESDRYLAVTIDNGVDVVKNPVNIQYNITHEVPDLVLSSVFMTVYNSSGDPIRTIDKLE
ncbi:MAG: transglutaminase domain-containing protein, partial [Nitrospirota bacterium]